MQYFFFSVNYHEPISLNFHHTFHTLRPCPITCSQIKTLKCYFGGCWPNITSWLDYLFFSWILSQVIGRRDSSNVWWMKEGGKGTEGYISRPFHHIFIHCCFVTQNPHFVCKISLFLWFFIKDSSKFSQILLIGEFGCFFRRDSTANSLKLYFFKQLIEYVILFNVPRLKIDNML